MEAQAVLRKNRVAFREIVPSLSFLTTQNHNCPFIGNASKSLFRGS